MVLKIWARTLSLTKPCSLSLPEEQEHAVDQATDTANSPAPLVSVHVGLPIGELWDLEALARQCKKLSRYSFMLTSIPLNHPGLIGTPANAIAIF